MSNNANRVSGLIAGVCAKLRIRVRAPAMGTTKASSQKDARKKINLLSNLLAPVFSPTNHLVRTPGIFAISIYFIAIAVALAQNRMAPHARLIILYTPNSPSVTVVSATAQSWTVNYIKQQSLVTNLELTSITAHSLEITKERQVVRFALNGVVRYGPWITDGDYGQDQKLQKQLAEQFSLNLLPEESVQVNGEILSAARVAEKFGKIPKTFTRTTEDQEESSPAQQFVAAHFLAAPGAKNEDSVLQTWSYISLRMPSRALAALHDARRQISPAAAAFFGVDIATLQSEQNQAAADAVRACFSGASCFNVSGAVVSYLKQHCGGRVWTNANDNTLSVYSTNPVPVCEVRIPLRILRQTTADTLFREIAQPLQLVTELSKMRLVRPVVNLTDSNAPARVEVRCLGAHQKPTDVRYTMRAGTFHVFAEANSPQSDAVAHSAVESVLEAVSLDAVKFAFPQEARSK